MIKVEEAAHIHTILIKNFGGATGLRDRPALESALNRPFQTFDGKELYPTTIEKAASLVQSLLMNHPFIDGNKRTGYTIMRLFLINNGLDIRASQDEKYKFVIDITSGFSDFTSIKVWLEANTNKLL